MIETDKLQNGVQLAGIENFRDFGCLRTASGQCVRKGKLFRSGDHSRATEDDLTKLSQLDIRTIIDLRRPIERQHAPSRRWSAFSGQCVVCDIQDDRVEWTASLKEVERIDAEWFRQDSLSFYKTAAFSERHKYLFAAFFKACSSEDGAIMIHCAAGKDRTGMLCALTHALLEVHHDDLMADFLRTNDPERISRGVHRLRGWLHQMTGRIIDDSALVTALRVEPEYLDAFFSSIASRYGTVRRYCEEHLSLPASSVERLSRRLIQSEPESSERKTPRAKDGSTSW